MKTRFRSVPVAAVLVLAASASPSGAVAPSTPVTLAGGGSTSPSQVPFSPPFPNGTSVGFTGPAGIAEFGSTMLLADSAGHRVFTVDRTAPNSVAAVAGSGAAGTSGDNSAAVTATLHTPVGVSPWAAGFVIGDPVSRRIRYVDQNGVITTYAGTGDTGFADGPLNTAMFGGPADVDAYFADVGSGFYVTDIGNRLVRHVSDTVSTRLGKTFGGAAIAEPPDPASNPLDVEIGDPADVSAISDSSFLTLTQLSAQWKVLKVAAGGVRRVAGGGADDPEEGADALTVELGSGGIDALADGGFVLTNAGDSTVWRVRPNGTLGLVAGGIGAGSILVTNDGLVVAEQAGNRRVLLIPSVAIVAGPTGLTADNTPSFTFGSWDESATFECALDDEPPITWGPCADGQAVSDGPHTLAVRSLTDGTRQSAEVEREFTVDSTAPASPVPVAPVGGTVVGAPAPELTWAPVADAGSGVARYEVSLDGTAIGTRDAGACAVTCSHGVPSALGDGAHEWSVRALDVAGNASPEAKATFTVSAPPTASLTVAPTRALLGRTVTFDGSGSSDPNGAIVHYEFDLDGDGTYETDSGASPRAARAYDRPQTLVAGMRVTDSGGLTATTTTTLVVTAPPPVGKQLGVSINDGAQYTNDPDVVVHAVWPAFASNMLISNDGGFKLAQAFPVAETTPWKLDSSGPERLPKTIYVRFTAGLQVSETYQDDIILDQTPPKVSTATVAGAARAAASAVKRVTLKIRASDNVSGVSRVQVTTNKRKPGRFLRYKRTLKVKPARKLFVRARDRAGNLSRWRAAKRR